MKKEKWFYNAQRLFKKWKSENKLCGECAMQKITRYTLEEVWFCYHKTEPHDPGEYTLFAFKNTDEVYLLKKYGHGRDNRIYLKKCQ